MYNYNLSMIIYTSFILYTATAEWQSSSMQSENDATIVLNKIQNEQLKFFSPS